SPNSHARFELGFGSGLAPASSASEAPSTTFPACSSSGPFIGRLEGLQPCYEVGTLAGRDVIRGVMVPPHQPRHLFGAPGAADQYSAVLCVMNACLARTGQARQARLGGHASCGQEVREHAPKHELRRT